MNTYHLPPRFFVLTCDLSRDQITDISPLLPLHGKYEPSSHSRTLKSPKSPTPYCYVTIYTGEIACPVIKFKHEITKQCRFLQDATCAKDHGLRFNLHNFLLLRQALVQWLPTPHLLLHATRIRRPLIQLRQAV